jgi:hypothetical protein
LLKPELSNHGRYQQKAVDADVADAVYQKVENISSLEVCAMMCSQLRDAKTGFFHLMTL